MYSKYLANFLGSSDVYSDFNCSTSSDLTFRSDYSFNSRSDLSKSDLCLVLGSDVRSEASNLNLIIGNYVKRGSLVLGYVGPSLDLSYEATHIGLGTEAVISLIKGTHPFCFHLKKAKNPYIIVGEKFNFSSIISYIYKLFNLGCLPNLKYSNISILRSKSASISFSELGINSLRIKKEFDILFLLGVNDLQSYRALNPKSFIIYLGSHYSVNNLEMADLILPASIFLEKDFKVINFENVLKSSKSLRKISRDVRPEWYLLLVLIFLFKSDLNFFNLDKKNILNSLFTFEYPFLRYNSIRLPVYNILNFDNLGSQKEIFNRKIFDFYRDNMLTRSSKNFKYSVNNLKQVQFKKNNVI
jgi:NADH-quinone oxidoreductase subunit G